MSGISLITKGILCSGTGGGSTVINRYVTPIRASLTELTQQINIKLVEAQNIKVKLADIKSVKVVLRDTQSVNVKLNDKKTINVKYRRI